LYVGQRPHHDRPGAYRHSANESAVTGDSARHKMIGGANRRAAQQRDELAPSQSIELHFGPRQPGPRIAGYRIGEDQSAGFSQPCRTSQPEHQLRSSDELASERPENDG